MTHNRLWVYTLATILIALVGAAMGVAASKSSHPKASAIETKASYSDVGNISFPSFPQPVLPPSPAPTDSGSLPRLAKGMVLLLNQARLNPENRAETRGLAKPLKWDPRLAVAALSHSEEMLEQHYFSHIDPDGDSPAERISQEGVQWEAMGENIAINYTAPKAEEAFMDEPRFQANHRGNILNPKFNYVGVGIVRAPDGRVYVTQDFAEEP